MNSFERKARAQDLARNNSAENIAHRLVAVEEQLEEARMEVEQSQQAQGDRRRLEVIEALEEAYSNDSALDFMRDAALMLRRDPSGEAVPDGYALVPKRSKSLGSATLCQIMDDYLPEEIENENDMAELIRGLWTRLISEWSVDAPPAPAAAPDPEAFTLLMRDITEQLPCDPDHERAVCVDYDWLYGRIQEAFLASPALAEPK